MLRVRSFGLAVGASVLFFAGFGAMLLAGVLFLTGVWHESVLTAGLMLFPGSGDGDRVQHPLGAARARASATASRACSARCCSWPVSSGTSPRRATRPPTCRSTCPGSLISGAGVGLMIPTLTGAGASSLAPERFATGAAVLTMGRQIGAALGVARARGGARHERRSTAADFHSAWLISVAGGLAAGLALAALGPPVRRRSADAGHRASRSRTAIASR